MPSSYISPPHCLCVGVMLINREGLVWVARRAPECVRVDAPGSWQMPQGPIAPAEPAREAALRVLEAETGVGSVEVLAEAPGWFTYELPADLIGVAFKGQYCGQKQKWLAMRLLGDDGQSHIEPRKGQRSVFRASRWVHAAEVPQLAPPLKRELYEDVVATFASFIAKSAAPREPSKGQTAVRLPWFVTVP